MDWSERPDSGVIPEAEVVPSFRSAGMARVPLPRAPIVGRTSELASVRDILSSPDVALLTLTGPGGIGKTRLALHVAAELGDAYADGVRFVPLASLTDPSLVAQAIAEALGVTESSYQPHSQNLKAHLRTQNLLLLLDNFEHLLGAAPLVADLLSDSPGISVLITSRTPLRISGEHEFPVPPLALPTLTPLPSPAHLAQTDAIALFLQRARAANSAFALTDENAADVAEICVQLDGLPLAIELAAARTRMLSPSWLRARVANRLLLLTEGPRDQPPRLQSMRDAVAWSYDLLGESDKAFFRLLSVFAGGFTLEAAEAVNETPVPTFELLATLVSNSLIGRLPLEDGYVRFSMLETIREYGHERLAAHGEAVTVADRHAYHFLHMAELADARQRDEDRDTWLNRLELDHANLRAALDWLAQRDAGHALRLAANLSWFWIGRGHLTEGRARLESLLARQPNELNSEPEIIAKAVLGVATLSATLDDYAASERWCQEALERCSALGDSAGVAESHLLLAQTAVVRGEPDVALSHARECLALYRQVEDATGTARALELNGMLAVERDNYEQARRFFQEALEISESLADWQLKAALQTLLAGTYEFQGDYALAASLIEDALAQARIHGDALRTAERLGRLASVALFAGDPPRALALAQEGASLFATSSRDIAPWARVVVLHNLGVALRRVSDPGQARTVHESALGLLRDIGSPPSWTASVLVELGNDIRDLGDSALAAQLASQALELLWDVGDRWGVAAALEALATTAATLGSHASAVRLIAAAASIRTEIGVSLPKGDRADVERTLAVCREAMGKHAVLAMMQESEQTSRRELVADAITFGKLARRDAVPDRRLDVSRPTGGIHGLSPRELQVLVLLAEGHSNPAIAEALFISRKTVRNHVTSILTKLGVDSRTAAATLALRRGLV